MTNLGPPDLPNADDFMSLEWAMVEVTEAVEADEPVEVVLELVKKVCRNEAFQFMCAVCAFIREDLT